MTTEKLLQPRYELIADFPSNYLIIGAILHNEKVKYNYDRDGRDEFFYLSDYPHLFRKLEWWEKRDIKDMPEYIERHGDGAIIKVDKWFNVGDDIRWHTDNPFITMSAETCSPSTKSEYLNQ